MKDQLNRMEAKLDDLIDQTSKNTADLSWVKKAGGIIFSALAYLFSKQLGGP